MKHLLYAILIFSYYITNAQQIRIGSYDGSTIVKPKIRDYGRIYTELGNQLNMQYSENPKTFRFHSTLLKTSIYNIEDLKEIYTTESQTDATIYIDFNTNRLIVDTNDGNDESISYTFTPIQSESYIAEGIIPNIGRFAISQYSDNSYIIMLFLYTSTNGYCTVKSYASIMTGSK